MTVVDFDPFPLASAYSISTAVEKSNKQNVLTRSLGYFFLSHLHLSTTVNYTANVYRQTTDELMFKSVISTQR
jgi:hypothetical protein